MYLNQLTPEQIAAARNFLNQNMAPYSGITPDNGTATGRNMWAFNGDFNPYNVPTNDAQMLTGAQSSMGISDANMASILGMDPAAYADYAHSISPKNQAYNAQGFAHDFSGLVDPTQMAGINKYLADGTASLDPSAGFTGTLPSAGPGSSSVTGSLGGAAAPATQHTGFEWSSNPYISQMGDALSRQYTNTLNEQWLPAIQNNAIASGGLGGSRQGVAQGLAIGRAGEGLSSALANMYGGAYENQQNRGLQQQQIDNNFYTAQRGQDLTQLGLGAELWNMGMTGPMSSLGSASSIYGGVGNQNNTTTGNSNTGGGTWGALGGMLGTAQLGKNLGWWG